MSDPNASDTKKPESATAPKPEAHVPNSELRYHRTEKAGIVGAIAKLLKLGEGDGAKPREKHVKAKIAVVAVLLCLAAGIAARYFLREPAPLTGPGEYYYDLSTGKTFLAPGGLVPPITAPSAATVDGHEAGVRAAVFSCGDCKDAGSQTVVYVEMLSPDVRKAWLEKQEYYKKRDIEMPPHAAAELREQLDAGEMIAHPGTTSLKWVVAASAEGQAISAEPATLCNGGPGIQCRP
jgi:hypothetical protein